MIKFYLREFKDSDVDDMVIRDVYETSSKEIFLKLARSTASFSIVSIKTQQVVCSISVMQFFRRVAEISMLCSNDFLSEKKDAIKFLRKGVDFVMDEFELDRVQCTIKASIPLAKKWISVLGFSEEGLMRKYGSDGSDHILFAKVRG